jgi:S1-C subfamily serine protease
LGQSIFHLEIETDNGINSGTAFAYRVHHLATAAHNLVGQIRLTLPTGALAVTDWTAHDRYTQAAVDCAIVRIEHGAAPLRVHPHMPSPGEPVAVIGFASVPGRHPSLGIYPGTVESINTNYQGTPFVQITVPSAGGLSGSPVINSIGDVVGIVVESAFEQTGSGVPNREFCTVLPIQRLSEVGRASERPGV